MTTYLSVDLAARGPAPTFWIISDYDTGLAKLVGEQTNLCIADIAKHTRRLAKKYEVEEVLIPSIGVGATLVDLLLMDSADTFDIIMINPEAKEAA